MKRYMISAALAGGLLVLVGCNNRPDYQAVSPAQPAELTPMQQSYFGTIPCADCSGIATSLFLDKEGTWVMEKRYQGKKQPLSIASWGTWARTANKLVLTDADGEKQYFHPQGNSLEILDTDGNPINSRLNYRLDAAKTTVPSVPMAMRGMYQYMADAAVFTDCASGKTYAVNNTIALEQGYAAAKGTGVNPVLVTIQGHFSLDANEDTGEPQLFITPDSAGHFQADKDCSTRP